MFGCPDPYFSLKAVLVLNGTTERVTLWEARSSYSYNKYSLFRVSVQSNLPKTLWTASTNVTSTNVRESIGELVVYNKSSWYPCPYE